MVLTDDRRPGNKWQVMALVVVLALGALVAFFLFRATEKRRTVRSDAAHAPTKRVAPPPAPDAAMPDLAVAPGIKLGVRTKESLDLGEGVTMAVAWVPAGSFMMGTMKDNYNRKDERPKHLVTISTPFYISSLEVTNQQYRRFRPAHRSGAYQRRDLDGPRQPVVNVTWHDAAAFCQWLSGRLKHRVRLPSEAEWEYAARGRVGGENHWVEAGGLEETHANVADATARAALRLKKAHKGEDGHAVTAPVGSLRPNKLGVFDTIGNAAEWTADWYAAKTYRRHAGDDPRGPAKGKMRVHRGGSWRSGPAEARAAARASARPTHRSPWLGFRVVVELTPEELE